MNDYVKFMLKRITELMSTEDLKAFEQTAQARRAELENFMNADHEERGRVLRAHLAIEFCLKRYFQNLMPTLCWADANLRFIQMVNLLSNEFPFNVLRDALKELNKIRNNFGHRLEKALAFEDLKKCELLIALHGKQRRDFDDPVQLVEDVVDISSFLLEKPGVLERAVEAASSEYRAAHPEESDDN